MKNSTYIVCAICLTITLLAGMYWAADRDIAEANDESVATISPARERMNNWIEVYKAIQVRWIEIGTSGIGIPLTDEQVEGLENEIIFAWGSMEEFENAARESACERERL